LFSAEAGREYTPARVNPRARAAAVRTACRRGAATGRGRPGRGPARGPPLWPPAVRGTGSLAGHDLFVRQSLALPGTGPGRRAAGPGRAAAAAGGTRRARR